MSLFDYISENPKAMLIIFSQLLNDERARIVSANLATQDEMDKLIGDFSNNFLLNGDKNLSKMANFHGQLKSVVLPGDFQKVAGDFYDLSSLEKLSPLSDENKLVYVLPGNVEVDEEVVEEAEEKLKSFLEESDEAKDGKKCSCETEKEEDDAMTPEEGTFAETMILASKLESVAYKLGSNGRHSEAIEIERKIDELRSYARDIWNEMSQMEQQRAQQRAQQPNMPQGMPQSQFQQLWNAQEQANKPQGQPRQHQQQQRQVQPQQRNQQRQVQPNRQQQQAQQKQRAPALNPQELQQHAGQIRSKIFQNPKVPQAYKNTGTIMRVLQKMVLSGQAKDVNSASQLLMKRLQRFQ